MHGEDPLHLLGPFDQRGPSVFILQAIILGTTFLQLSTNTTAYYSRGGILFLSVLIHTSPPLSNGLQRRISTCALCNVRNTLPLLAETYRPATLQGGDVSPIC